MCRSCYVHPGVLDAYANGTLATSIPETSEPEGAAPPAKLSPEEASVLALLRRADYSQSLEIKAG